MRKFIPITIAVLAFQATIACAVYSETIKQRDYVYAYDEEARGMEDDVFVICTDCPDSRLNEIYTIAARYSVDPGMEKVAKADVSDSTPITVPSVKKEDTAIRNLLGIVRFKFDSYALSAKSKEQLDSYQLTNKQVRLEGYTCTIGTDKYNKKLSLNRAKEVAKYLRSKGISVIDISGLGKSNKFSEKTLNRRVEIFEREKE